jgi:hypothetical protein
LFDGAVSCELLARISLREDALPPGAAEQAERLLRDLATMEERRVEVEDVHHPADPALRRLEAKIDLTLQLLLQALPQLSPTNWVPVMLSVRGLRVDALIGEATKNETATLTWQPSDTLPLSVQLPLRRIATDAERSWWAFDALDPALNDALERHVFRLHRRWLAAQRRA